jgi:hypothetical protein
MVGDGLKNIEKIKGNVFWCCPQLSCVINLVGTLKTLLHPIPSTLKEYHHPSFPYFYVHDSFENNIENNTKSVMFGSGGVCA